jgi:hypothetical protein
MWVFFFFLYIITSIFRGRANSLTNHTLRSGLFFFLLLFPRTVPALLDALAPLLHLPPALSQSRHSLLRASLYRRRQRSMVEILRLQGMRHAAMLHRIGLEELAVAEVEAIVRAVEQGWSGQLDFFLVVIFFFFLSD